MRGDINATYELYVSNALVETFTLGGIAMIAFMTARDAGYDVRLERHDDHDDAVLGYHFIYDDSWGAYRKVG